MNVTHDKRFFSDLEFEETQVKDKEGNVVGEVDENGCWCLNNGFKIAKPKEQTTPKQKPLKIKL